MDLQVLEDGTLATFHDRTTLDQTGEAHDHILTTSTIDDEDEMKEYQAMEELDGIVTNRPDVLNKVTSQ